VRLALTAGEAHDNRSLANFYLADVRNNVLATVVMTPTDQSPCRQERRLGQYPATVQSQRADLLQPYLYRARNLVERFFKKIKHCLGSQRATISWRRTTRLVQLASIRLWLRVMSPV